MDGGLDGFPRAEIVLTAIESLDRLALVVSSYLDTKDAVDELFLREDDDVRAKYAALGDAGVADHRDVRGVCRAEG
jgi:hypothetical protein